MNAFRPDSRCGQIWAVIGAAAGPVETSTIAEELGLCRHDVSRFLTSMRRMGYVVQETRATLGRYAKAATWRVAWKAQGSATEGQS